MKIVIRTEEEIQKVVDIASEKIEEIIVGDNVIYAHGVKDMYDWLVGNTNLHPFE